MSETIQGKVILVTGANRGIGKSLVETFIEHGADKVYAAVRSLDSAKPLVEKYGDKVVPIHIDLALPQSIRDAAEKATDVQIVISNAGVLKTTEVLDPSAIDSLEFEININVYGLVRMAQAFAPVLKANGGGVFGQLNSVVSVKAFANFATYSASKAASYSITQSLKDALAEQGTTVLSIHPGPIATDMGDAAGLTEIAEPPSLVGEAIVKALEAGEFHVYPDSMAKQIGEAYQSYAKNIVEAKMMEG